MTILLLLLLAPERPTALDPLQWMVDGQWEAEAKLPNGQKIESRTIWDWGPGRQSVRGRVYIRKEEKEYLQYESVVYWNADTERIESITFSLQGAVSRGTGEIAQGTLTLEQPAKKLFPPMRSIYRPDKSDKNRYVGENYWKQGGEWKLVLSAEQKRAPRNARAALASKSPMAARLAPFKPLVGEWKCVNDQGGADELKFEHSLHGGVIRTTTVFSKDRIEAHWIYFDPDRSRLAVFGCDADGSVEQFELAVEAGERRLALTVEMQNGEKVEAVARNTMTWKTADEFASRIESFEDGAWQSDDKVALYRRK